MGRFIKKLLILVTLLAGLAAAFRVLKRRRDESMPGRVVAPQWNPRDQPGADPPVPLEAPAPDPAPPIPQDWVPPIHGTCPQGYPIKVNSTSGIYHVPHGRSYARTVAQRCYATAETAERDGYRRAKA